MPMSQPMSSPESLIVTQNGGVLTLSINDPPINRMTMACMDAVALRGM